MVRKNYYGAPEALEPMCLYFTAPLIELGHEVETFDHFEMSRTLGKARATEALVDKIEKGDFQVVFYQSSGAEPVETSALRDLKKKICIAAWNSDDDWQWETTRRIAGHFTFMITTYPHIYEQNHFEYANLLLSQWGCPSESSGPYRLKDIVFSFAGSIYGVRNKACRYLRKRAGLVCFGRGARLVQWGLPYFRGVFKFPWLAGRPMQLAEVRGIWNRSRISYTPLASDNGRQSLQIKGRLFEMGLSGTMVLCEDTPLLERYYQPGREVITFKDLTDCADKALWYLSHESERAAIAGNYRRRTLREHMWVQRFADLLTQMGITDGHTLATK